MFTRLCDAKEVQYCVTKDEGVGKGLLPKLDKIVISEGEVLMTVKLGVRPRET